jgi:hypothetical protein
MTAVYINGPDKAIAVSEWIRNNLKNCDYNLTTDPPATFSNRYKFNFQSNIDATMVALRWGNEYGGLSCSTGAS